MASHWTNIGCKQVLDETIKLSTNTIKVMLCTASLAHDQDDDALQTWANDYHQTEITCSNYTGGFGGSGRKTIGTKTFNADDSTNRAQFRAASSVWSSLGAAPTATIAHAVIIKENTGEGDSIPIIVLEFTAVTTNGGDFTLQWDATNGIGYIAT